MDKINVLVLGDGFLGSEFRSSDIRQVEYVVRGRSFLDMYSISSSHDALTNTVEFAECDVVLNMVGNSDTRYCENKDNWNDVFYINSQVPKILHDICLTHGKKFVHISTGCVYENTQGLKTEESPIESHCNYVTSKIVGELFCGGTDLIIRPRLLFNGTKSNKNLLVKLHKFTEYLNEFNTITSTGLIRASITALLLNNRSGVYNVGHTGTYTIHQMAQHLDLTDETAKPIRQGELIKQQGLHLVNNVMDMSKLITDTGIGIPDTLDMLEYYTENLND